MNFQSLLFSFEGRIGRKIFWIWNVCYYAAIIILISLANTLVPLWAHLLVPVILLVLLYPDLAMTAKRWHDRNKSSWWLLLNVPLLIGRLAAPVAASAADEPMMTWQTTISFVALFCGVWILVECGFLKGTPGENRFGPAVVSSS